MERKRVSTSLDLKTVALACELAAEEGMSLSAWISRAVENQARKEDGLRAIREVEAELGPIPEEARQWARHVFQIIDVNELPHIPWPASPMTPAR